MYKLWTCSSYWGMQYTVVYSGLQIYVSVRRFYIFFMIIHYSLEIPQKKTADFKSALLLLYQILNSL